MPLVHRFYAAYWGEGADLSDEVVVAQVLRAAGHDPEEVMQRAQQQEVKDDLRQRTEKGIAAGLFGVPGFVVDGGLYWGQDRLNQVERALGGTVDTMPLGSEGLGKIALTDLWFDFSSPFAYLAACRAPALFGAALRLRPMLLGAVFKMVGAPNVPFFAMNEAKRSWVTSDLACQAQEAGVPLRWPSGFPLKTVLPLRMTLLALEDAPDRAAAFVASVFTALWQDDASPEDADLMASLAEAAGFDGQALVVEASSERAKALLRTETSAAVAAGVFGAPGIVVHGASGPALFWGNDRLELALEAALR
jgi:2-hydroxychromene-2-carboxylate isomerase